MIYSQTSLNSRGVMSDSKSRQRHELPFSTTNATSSMPEVHQLGSMNLSQIQLLELGEKKELEGDPRIEVGDYAKNLKKGTISKGELEIPNHGSFMSIPGGSIASPINSDPVSEQDYQEGNIAEADDQFFEEYKQEKALLIDRDDFDDSDENQSPTLLLGVNNKEPMSPARKSRRSIVVEAVDENHKKKLEGLKVPPQIHAKLESIVEKVKFKEIMQKLNSGQQAGLSQTPAYIFQQECKNTMDLMLPIVNKIQFHCLSLNDYKLQPG